MKMRSAPCNTSLTGRSSRFDAGGVEVDRGLLAPFQYFGVHDQVGVCRRLVRRVDAWDVLHLSRERLAVDGGGPGAGRHERHAGHDAGIEHGADHESDVTPPASVAEPRPLVVRQRVVVLSVEHERRAVQPTPSTGGLLIVHFRAPLTLTDG